MITQLRHQVRFPRVDKRVMFQSLRSLVLGYMFE